MPSRRDSRRKALGQHYLTDGSVVDLMVKKAMIRGGERVMEVGTGTGAVTRELCRAAPSVEAFELDHDNYLVTERLGLKGLTLHEGDAFAQPREFDVLVSSLPYSESSNFVEWLAKLRYDRAVVLLQRDFAEKLVATPDDEQYRAISVIAQISSGIEIVRRVGRESFDPPPRVTSVLAVMTWRRTMSAEQVHTVKMLFSQRKRKLAGALKSLGMEMTGEGPLLLSRRVERLSAGDVEELLGRVRPVQTISTSRGKPDQFEI
jgi:16S rRNA (adenine1518-N6/adenine1519-N6)-dimethyltransferase